MQELAIAVVGGGLAGCECALRLARAGHAVTLFEKQASIGGQFNHACRIPGKEEFRETLRYYGRMLGQHGVSISSILQRKAEGEEGVPIIVITHRAFEKDVQAALKAEGLA